MKLLDLIMQVEEITRTNENERHAIIRSFSRLSTDFQIEIMSTHRKLLYKLKQKYQDVEISTLSYSALIITLRLNKVDREKLKRLNLSDMNLDEIRDITSKSAKLFLQKQFRIQTKRERLLGFWAVVYTLKIDEKMSFRKIKAYLKKHHKFEVSYSTISKVWNQMEQNKDKKNG